MTIQHFDGWSYDPDSGWGSIPDAMWLFQYQFVISDDIEECEDAFLVFVSDYWATITPKDVEIDE